MSDDKLKKSTSAIEVAGNFGEALTRALPQDEKPVSTVRNRWPDSADTCKCGHSYSEHNYSDSLGSKTDPLGFMYECRGGGFGRNAVPADPECMCKRFEFANIVSVPPAERVDLLEVAESLRKCTHPMHGLDPRYAGQPCGKVYIISKEDRCRPNCSCCSNAVGIGDDAIVAGSVAVEPVRVENNKLVSEENLCEIGEWINYRGETVKNNKLSGSQIAPITVATPRISPGKFTAEVVGVKTFVDKTGRTQLAVEMAIKDPKLPATCDARTSDGNIIIGCKLPPGHSGPHKAATSGLILPLEWS